MSDTTDKAAGKTKKVVGKLTNNHELEAKGKAQETKGDVKSAAKDVKNHLSDAIHHKK